MHHFDLRLLYFIGIYIYNPYLFKAYFPMDLLKVLSYLVDPNVSQKVSTSLQICLKFFVGFELIISLADPNVRVTDKSVS